MAIFNHSKLNISSPYFSRSSQSSGFRSVTSTISFGGKMDGSISSNKLPELINLLSIYILKLLSAERTKQRTIHKNSFPQKGFTQSINMRFLIGKIRIQRFCWFLRLMFTINFRFRITITNNKMIFMIYSTHIWSKHDCIRCFICHLFLNNPLDHQSQTFLPNNPTKSSCFPSLESNFT